MSAETSHNQNPLETSTFPDWIQLSGSTIPLMHSRNFEFLRPHFRELADLGGFAEAYAQTDPSGCLVKLRLFAENLVKAVFSHHRLERSFQSNLNDLLADDSFRSITPSVVLEKIHLLRRIQFIEAWGRGIPLILEKAPNVRFTQVAGIFITEFPRPESEAPVTPPVAVLVLLRALQSMGPLGNSEILLHLGLKDRTHLRNHYIDPALAANLIERTIPDKPNSRLQKYSLTPKGKSLITNH